MYYTKDYDNIIDNYLENCSEKEWKKLLSKYNIEDNENYIGEVREKVENAIYQDYINSTFKEQVKMLTFFEKYKNLEKEKQEKNEKNINKIKMKILQEDIEYLKNNNILSIDQLLYNKEEFEKYKEWKHKTRKGEEVEIVSIWPTDYGDIGCTAILYKNKKPVAKIYDSHEISILQEVFWLFK